MDEAGPTQYVHCEIDRGAGSFEGKAFAVRFAGQGPADFAARPILRFPGSDTADPGICVAFDDAKHAVAPENPRTDIGCNGPPGAEAGLRNADKARDFRSGLKFRPGWQIGFGGAAQDQPFGSRIGSMALAIKAFFRGRRADRKYRLAARCR
jgi:hypothetical protein